jgi:hypothetical protein
MCGRGCELKSHPEQVDAGGRTPRIRNLEPNIYLEPHLRAVLCRPTCKISKSGRAALRMHEQPLSDTRHLSTVT